MPLDATIAGFKKILAGELDRCPEQAFYMAGGIDKVEERWAPAPNKI